MGVITCCAPLVTTIASRLHQKCQYFPREALLGIVHAPRYPRRAWGDARGGGSPVEKRPVSCRLVGRRIEECRAGKWLPREEQKRPEQGGISYHQVGARHGPSNISSRSEGERKPWYPVSQKRGAGAVAVGRRVCEEPWVRRPEEWVAHLFGRRSRHGAKSERAGRGWVEIEVEWSLEEWKSRIARESRKECR